MSLSLESTEINQKPNNSLRKTLEHALSSVMHSKKKISGLNNDFRRPNIVFHTENDVLRLCVNNILRLNGFWSI